MLQRRLGDDPHRVGLLLAVQRRITLRVVDPRLGVEAVSRRVQRLDQDGANLGREPTSHDDHAVCVLIHLQGAAAMPGRDLPVLGGAIDVAPAADESLDMGGGAGLAERQQPLLGVRRCHAREGPDLGVGQFTVSQRVADLRQIAERARHPHTLAGGVELDADTPRQPLGAALRSSVGPAVSGVELADEVQ